MKIRDPHDMRGGLNTDDSPSNLPPGDYVGSKNARTLSSDEQHGAGIWETLQGEIEILLGVSAPSYYGGAIGGEFIYYGFDEFTVGNQTWMKKNYDVEYPGSKVYDDDEDNTSIYGRLYTHGQAMSADFCPPGWRMPTEADADELLAELGGEMLAGGRMKEVGDSHWTPPNTGADDSSGFRAVPGGKFDLLFDLLGGNCILWLQDDGVPSAPVALNGSEITNATFIANWSAVVGVNGYYLDVATDENFTAMVAGFDGLDVGNVLLREVIGLTSSTIYYFRVRAYNEVGASENSNTKYVETDLSDLLDMDGNVYDTIIIGNQEFIDRNLRTATYADGTPIPNITDNAAFVADITGAYCWKDDDIANRDIWGGYYNRYACVNAHGLAYLERGGVQEAGWRVASYADMELLRAELRGYGAGGKMKEMGLDHWNAPNYGATNESGFTGIGGGERNETGFVLLKEYALFQLTDGAAYLYRDSGNLSSNLAVLPEYGMNVRLVRDVVSPVTFGWFLPSKDLLWQMHLNLILHGVGGMTGEAYASSSEVSATTFWELSGASLYEITKESVYSVRAVRSFFDIVGAYSLRDVGPAGGLICYIDGVGTTYYEAAPSDQSDAQIWSNITGVEITGTGTAIGTGEANTDLIIAQTGHTESAAQLCKSLVV